MSRFAFFVFFCWNISTAPSGSTRIFSARSFVVRMAYELEQEATNKDEVASD
jgi:hypothetical protein